MKASTKIIVLVLTLGMCWSAGAQLRIIPKEIRDSVVAPHLSRDSSLLSFETMRIEASPMNEDDAPAQFCYRFRNVGKKVLKIRLTTTCSCLSAVCDKAEVLPEDMAVITVRYNPKGHVGRFERRIFVYTDEGTAPTAVLNLSVTVESGTGLSSTYPVQMGLIRLRRDAVTFVRGVKAGEKIRFINLSGAPLNLKCDSFFLPECLALSTRPEVVQDGEEGRLLFPMIPPKEGRGKRCL